MTRFIFIRVLLLFTGVSVIGADVPLSGLPLLTTPATNDFTVVVDVSDTTQAPSGTTKRITWKALMGIIFQGWDEDLTRISEITTTQGDLFVALPAGWTNLARGSDGQVLKMSGTNVVWGTDAAGVAGVGFATSNVTVDASSNLVEVASGTATNFLAGDRTHKQVTTNMVPGLVADINSKQNSDADLATVAALTSGTSTNFFSGDGTFKQVTTNMIPGLVSGLAAKQNTDTELTTVASLTSGTSTNFFAGDGAFKQVTTNMVPGLVTALAAKQPLDTELTTVAALTSGNSTNFFAGDGSFKQVTTNMVPGLVSGLAAKQNTDTELTTVAALTGGNATNFFSGDGTFKQVTTNMIPGLNAALAAAGGSGFQPIATGVTNAFLVTDGDGNIAATNEITLDELDVTGALTAGSISAGGADVSSMLVRTPSALTAHSAVTNFVGDMDGGGRRHITLSANFNLLHVTNSGTFVKEIELVLIASGADRLVSIPAAYYRNAPAFISGTTVVTNGQRASLVLASEDVSNTNVHAAFVHWYKP